MFLAALPMMTAYLFCPLMMFVAAVFMMTAQLVLSIPDVFSTSVHDESSPCFVHS
jgi:hypothetical protein